MELWDSFICWAGDWAQNIVLLSDAALGALATLITGILASFIAPVVGLKVYRRQKEYEIVRQRYLDEGLDPVIAKAEGALGVMRFNWARGLQALKMYREMGVDMPKSLYNSGYIESDPGNFNATHGYLITSLLGKDIYWASLQKLHAFSANANAAIINELCSVLRLSVEGGNERALTRSREEVIESLFVKMKEMDLDAKKHYVVVHCLQDFAVQLSKENFRFRAIDEFKFRKIVLQRTKELEEFWGSEEDSAE